MTLWLNRSRVEPLMAEMGSCLEEPQEPCQMPLVVVEAGLLRDHACNTSSTWSRTWPQSSFPGTSKAWGGLEFWVWFRLRGDGPSGKISPAPAPMRLCVGFDARGGSRGKAGQGPNHWKLPLLLLKLLIVAKCEDGLTGCCSACDEIKRNGLLLCPSVGPLHFHSCQMFRESAKCRRLYPSGQPLLPL